MLWWHTSTLVAADTDGPYTYVRHSGGSWVMVACQLTDDMTAVLHECQHGGVSLVPRHGSS